MPNYRMKGINQPGFSSAERQNHQKHPRPKRAQAEGIPIKHKKNDAKKMGCQQPGNAKEGMIDKSVGR
jgi:hypothetical protein